ncbi:MAG TPA: glycosyltransferase family 4 protein [Abditibacteriaceae bacterium]|jgi:glycosyltransferase involved in cell wall biosynthesis
MNVLYLNHSEQMSGAENSLRALLWQLRRAHSDIEPIIALPGSGPFSQTLRDEGWNVTFAPLRRVQRPQGVLSGMTTLVHILRTAPFVAHLADKTRCDIIHSNSTTAHLVGGLAGERTGKPTLWHARDLVSLGNIAPALAHRASVIVAISGCVAERLQSDGIPADKIRVIHNGLDTDEWQPRESSLRESIALAPDSFLFGCAAQLVPWKNQSTFIEAAALLAQDERCARARFAILGGDLWGEHRDYAAQLREQIKQHHLQDRFNFVPHQSDNVAALSALDAVVLPSLEEPFGRVIMEGMALSKPVIAFGANGPLEIVTHEHDGLLVTPDSVAQANAEALAKAMKRVLHDAELAHSLGANGRTTVVERFHIRESAASISSIYHELGARDSGAAQSVGAADL